MVLTDYVGESGWSIFTCKNKVGRHAPYIPNNKIGMKRNGRGR
jgi:hypothetical protein